MIDPRILRNEPELLEASLRRRGIDLDVTALVSLDERRRAEIARGEAVFGAFQHGIDFGLVRAVTRQAFDEIIDLFHSVDPAYRASPSCRFMFNDSTLSAIRKLKDGDGNYLWQAADGRAGEPAAILGRGYVINQAMDSIATAKKTVLFGDMNKYVVRRVRDFTLLRLAERYAEYYQVGFLAFNRLDGELLDTAAVKHLVQA